MMQEVKNIEPQDLTRLFLSGKAAQNLITYTELTYPKYKPNWHHKVIARHLEEAAAGNIKRFMILVPPRYGKSELSSIRLPAWYLGKYPDKKVIVASYSDWFSLQFGKHARNVCQTEMHRYIFPESRIRKDSSSAALWELDAGGKFVAVGRGGSVTGHGAHLLILDDLIKNVQEAYSENIRDNIWEWYRTTLFTRLEQDASIVIVNTRWHEDDLIGRLLEHEGEKWTVLKMPAIADKDYDYGKYRYKQGATLWDEKYPLDTVLETQEVMGSHFDSIYQQEWVSLWELCQSQRYGQGMTIGTLVHSEIWNNLSNLDFEGQLKLRAFRVVIATDEIFRDFAIKSQDKKSKRGSNPQGLESIRNQMESLESSGKSA